jgi:SDR family mycofactocin-dependent oxidoreductase
MGRVAGKVALITGAARGQGRSHAVRLAEEGANVVVADICRQIDAAPYPLATPEDLAETERLIKQTGRGVLARQVDVRDQAALDTLVADAVTQFGHLDIVIANAGITSYSLLHELSDTDFTTVMDVNAGGAWRTIKAATPRLISQGTGGSIILTSSVAGMKGMQHLAHYSASKHAIVGLMRSASLELAPHHIRVNSVNPGGVLTPMIDNDMTRRIFRPELAEPTLDDMAEMSRPLHPMQIPWLEAIDISSAVVFLASDEARYLTGAVLPVDGGMSTA